MRSRRPESRLGNEIEGLHFAVLQSIKQRDLYSFTTAMEVYGDILLTLPREWARYGESFEQGLASGLDLRPSPLDDIMRKLYEELGEVMRAHSREFLDRALALPYRVMAESIALSAHALWSAMLTHLTVVCRLASEDPTDPVRELGSDLAIRYQFELGRYYVGSVIEDDSATIEARTSAGRFISEWFDSLIELGKFLIETSQSGRLESLNSDWEQVLEYWQPEYDSPRDFEVEALEQVHGAEHDDVALARQRLALNRAMVDLKTSLIDQRQQERFGLLWWAFRLWGSGAGDAERCFDVFLDSFSDATSLTKAARDCIRLEFGDRSPPWSRWLLSELPEGRAYALGTDSSLTQALLAALLIRSDLPIAPSDLQGFADRADDVLRTLEGLANDERVLSRASADRVEDRAAAIRGNIMAAARQRRDEEAAVLRGAPLVDEKVALFRRLVLDEWSDSRLLSVLFEVPGRSKLHEFDPQRTEPPLFGRDELLPKGLFTSVQEVHGLEMVGENIGDSITSGEIAQLLKLVDSSTSSSLAADVDLPRGIDLTIDAMRTEGYEPSVIFIPISWQLNQALEVGHFAQEPPRETPYDNNERRRRWYLGFYGDLAVFTSPVVSPEKVLLLDVEGLGTLHQWPVNAEGELLLIEISTYDDESAEQVVRAQPDLFADLESEPARAATLQERVRSKVLERFQIEIQDPKASRAVPIPETLRGPG